MNTLLKKFSGWFGSNAGVPGNSSFPHSRNPQHSMLHDGSETATRGQLVQVLLRDLVRKSGIPQGWIQCQIQVVNSQSRGKGLYVRLVVRHWDERLMKYAFAFQKALLTDIVQFEPKAADWLHGISWQLEVAASCTLTELPDSKFWHTPVTAAEPVDPFDIIPMPANAVAAPIPKPATPTAMAAPTVPAARQDDTAQDLERLFAIRDNELANVVANNLLPAGYESTEPSPSQHR